MGSSLGTMTAYVGLDYSDMMRGLGYSKGQLNDFQTYTVRVQGQQGRAAGQAAGAAAVAIAASGKNAGAASGGVLRGIGSTIVSLARMGVGVATAYNGWKLHSIRMKNELLQNQLLLQMVGKGPPGGGAGLLAWFGQVRNATTSNRTSLMGVLRTALAVSGVVAGLGAAAVYGYGMWRAQSARIRTDLMQQKVLAEQLRQMRGGSVGGGGVGMGSIAGGMLLGGMIGRGVSAIGSAPGMALKLAAEAEQAQIAFEVMLGSADKAKSMLAQLQAYADRSPFNVAGVNEAAQKLLNYGMQAQDILPTIKMLGDVAAGDMEKFDRLATAFGQMTSTGRLMGQDLLQFINAGFNPLLEISKKTGESMAALKKRMEAGGISAMEVNQAFQAATSAGGRFENMTERQSQTVAGKWSTMKDAVSSVLRQLGEDMIRSVDLKAWLDYLTAGLQQVPFVFRHIGPLFQIGVIDWGMYLMDIVPYGKKASEELYAVFVGLWASLNEGWRQFKQDSDKFVSDALVGPQGTFLGVGVKKGGLIDRLTGGQYSVENQNGGKVPNKDPIPGILAVGEKARLDALKGFAQPGNSLKEQLAKQKADLLAGITAFEAKLPQLNAPQMPDGPTGASFNSSTEVKGKKDGQSGRSAQSNAALAMTSEAARIMTSEFGGKIPQEQLATLKRIEQKLGPQSALRRPQIQPLGQRPGVAVEMTNL